MGGTDYMCYIYSCDNSFINLLKKSHKVNINKINKFKNIYIR